MSLAATVKKFLDTHRVVYGILHHDAGDLSQAVSQLHIEPHNCLQGCVFEDELGPLLVTIPLDKIVNLKKIQEIFARDIRAVKQKDVARYFHDCEPGAIPPLGEAYNMGWVIDASVFTKTILYFSTGSNSSLIQIGSEDFRFLCADARILAIAENSSKISNLL